MPRMKEIRVVRFHGAAAPWHLPHPSAPDDLTLCGTLRPPIRSALWRSDWWAEPGRGPFCQRCVRLHALTSRKAKA